MTENDARAIYCPQSFAVNEVRDGNGNGIREGGPFTCFASRCMAWRWSEEKRTAAFLEAVQAHMQGQAKPNFNTATQAVYVEHGGKFERVEGYCGLAGAL